MTIEVNIVGRRCGAEHGGLSCVYCYLPMPARVKKEKVTPDLPNIKASLLKEGGHFNLFGGEPLLADIKDIEDLWQFGLEKFGRNAIQTSGRPITPEIYELFIKYKVSVGFSIDGPGHLNNPRWAGSLEETEKATAHSIRWLEHTLLDKKISCGLIVTLHRKNATGEALPKLLDWLTRLDKLGLQSASLHLLEHDGPVKHLAPSHEENLAALKAIQERSRTFKHLKFSIFEDVKNLLLASDGNVKCIWTACDPWNTNAVRGIQPDGTRSICHRVHRDGREWYPTRPGPRARQLGLAQTPQEKGGCKDCRFLIMCKGQCPGTAIDDDWRNRSRDCPTWFGLFEYVEEGLLRAGLRPLSQSPGLKKLEMIMINAWAQGRDMSVSEAVATLVGPRRVHGQRHGHADHNDHTDTGVSQQ
jgi:uncharacterized protein